MIVEIMMAATLAGSMPVIKESVPMARITAVDRRYKRKARRNARNHCWLHRDISSIFNFCVGWDAGPCYQLGADRAYCNADYIIAFKDPETGKLARQWYCASNIYMKLVGTFVRVTKPRPVYQCIPLGDKG